MSMKDNKMEPVSANRQSFVILPNERSDNRQEHENVTIQMHTQIGIKRKNKENVKTPKVAATKEINMRRNDKVACPQQITLRDYVRLEEDTKYKFSDIAKSDSYNDSTAVIAENSNVVKAPQSSPEMIFTAFAKTITAIISLTSFIVNKSARFAISAYSSMSSTHKNPVNRETEKLFQMDTASPQTIHKGVNFDFIEDLRHRVVPFYPKAFWQMSLSERALLPGQKHFSLFLQPVQRRGSRTYVFKQSALHQETASKVKIKFHDPRKEVKKINQPPADSTQLATATESTEPPKDLQIAQTSLPPTIISPNRSFQFISQIKQFLAPRAPLLKDHEAYQESIPDKLSQFLETNMSVEFSLQKYEMSEIYVAYVVLSQVKLEKCQENAILETLKHDFEIDQAILNMVMEDRKSKQLAALPKSSVIETPKLPIPPKKPVSITNSINIADDNHENATSFENISRSSSQDYETSSASELQSQKKSKRGTISEGIRRKLAFRHQTSLENAPQSNQLDENSKDELEENLTIGIRDQNQQSAEDFDLTRNDSNLELVDIFSKFMPNSNAVNKDAHSQLIERANSLSKQTNIKINSAKTGIIQSEMPSDRIDASESNDSLSLQSESRPKFPDAELQKYNSAKSSNSLDKSGQNYSDNPHSFHRETSQPSLSPSPILDAKFFEKRHSFDRAPSYRDLYLKSIAQPDLGLPVIKKGLGRTLSGSTPNLAVYAASPVLNYRGSKNSLKNQNSITEEVSCAVAHTEPILTKIKGSDEIVKDDSKRWRREARLRAKNNRSFVAEEELNHSGHKQHLLISRKPNECEEESVLEEMTKNGLKIAAENSEQKIGTSKLSVKSTEMHLERSSQESRILNVFRGWGITETLKNKFLPKLTRQTPIASETDSPSTGSSPKLSPKKATFERTPDGLVRWESLTNDLMHVDYKLGLEIDDEESVAERTILGSLEPDQMILARSSVQKDNGLLWPETSVCKSNSPMLSHKIYDKPIAKVAPTFVQTHQRPLIKSKSLDHEETGHDEDDDEDETYERESFSPSSLSRFRRHLNDYSYDSFDEDLNDGEYGRVRYGNGQRPLSPPTGRYDYSSARNNRFSPPSGRYESDYSTSTRNNGRQYGGLTTGNSTFDPTSRRSSAFSEHNALRRHGSKELLSGSRHRNSLSLGTGSAGYARSRSSFRESTGLGRRSTYISTIHEENPSVSARFRERPVRSREHEHEDIQWELNRKERPEFTEWVDPWVYKDTSYTKPKGTSKTWLSRISRRASHSRKVLEDPELAAPAGGFSRRWKSLVNLGEQPRQTSLDFPLHESQISSARCDFSTRLSTSDRNSRFDNFTVSGRIVDRLKRFASVHSVHLESKPTTQLLKQKSNDEDYSFMCKDAGSRMKSWGSLHSLHSTNLSSPIKPSPTTPIGGLSTLKSQMRSSEGSKSLLSRSAALKAKLPPIIPSRFQRNKV